LEGGALTAVRPQEQGSDGATGPPRTLHLANPLLHGPDVAALQRLLTAGAAGDVHPGPVDGEYGPLTAAAVRRAKRVLGYPEEGCNEVAGPRLVALLGGAAAAPAGFAARAASRQAEESALRARIVANARWGIVHEARIHYRQLRPIDGLGEPRRLPLETDCSGFVTLCYAWAGAEDPNGLAYSGAGYTGTLLAHMTTIPVKAAQPGDLVVWGPPPGHHVALALEDGDDPLLCSHGQERGPLAIRFSSESSAQPAPATWLSCLA
jgi:cell wall-associated NlpC family hydrolase